MAKFVVGDRVFGKSMLDPSFGKTGEVTNGFYYRDPEGKPPQVGQVPVQWDNGDSTYVSECFLDYETW